MTLSSPWDLMTMVVLLQGREGSTSRLVEPSGENWIEPVLEPLTGLANHGVSEDEESSVQE